MRLIKKLHKIFKREQKHSKGNSEEDDLPTASSAFDHSENEDDAEDDVSDEEESFDTQLIRRNFSEAFEEYRNKILEYQSSNPQDPSINRAMIAMTKTLRRSMKCLPATIQNQMHNFGKGTIAKNRSKKGGTIKINSPSLSRRTFKVPGRGPVPQGQRPARFSFLENSREFFFHFHFSFSISSRFNFTFTSRKRVKGFYFSLFTSRKK